MAAKGVNIDANAFTCSICLDLLKDPTSIPCGHSYCMKCVDTHWNTEDEKQSYSCPQCRHSFTQRPVLVKNTVLAILMEGLQKSGPPSAAVRPSSPLVCPASGGNVSCDLCCGKEVRAVKSCLQCLVSYCKEHLQPHNEVTALKKHKLVEPTDNLQENICSRHDEVMKMFCRTDQQCICYLCSVDLHKGHHTVTAAAERAEKQGVLQALQQNMVHRLNSKQKDIEHLQHQVKSSSHSSKVAEELCDRSLKELAALLVKRMSEVRQQIKAQQEAEELRVQKLQEKVQQEIIELKRTLAELNTLSQTEDHVHFLHKFTSLSKISETSVSVNSRQSPPPFQDMVTATVLKLRSALQETSLTEPPAALHKPKVLPNTEVSPAGAQAAAPPQQTSQSQQSQYPQHTQGESSLLQNFEGTGHLDFAAVVHKLKLNSPDDQPEGIQLIAPPDGCTLQECLEYQRNNLKYFPVGHNAMVHHWASPHRSSLQDTGEFPVLSRHKKTGGPPGRAQVPTTAAAPQQTSKNLSTHPHRDLRPKTPAQCSTVYHVTSFPIRSTDDSFYWKMKKYARRLTWDPRSLSDKMELFNENCSVKRMAYSQKYKPHPLRFTTLPQVVSKESLTGQCFFEVFTKYEQTCTIAVTYKDIKRDGSSDKCSFGMNAKSWAVECHRDHCVIWHNGHKEEIGVSDRNIGVFVDYKAGRISFFHDSYELFTFRTTFTGPLAAGVCLEDIASTVNFGTRMFINHRYEDDFD